MVDGYFRADGLGPSKGSRMSPFRTFSNAIYPRTVNETLIWAAWFYSRNAKYRTLLQKIVSYFLAGIKVECTSGQENVDSDDVQELHDRLENVYEVLETTNRFGIELAAMGNVFVSCERIFSRLLLCPKCSWQMAVKQLRKGRDYTWTGKSFEGDCPQCHEHVTFNIKDVPAQTPDGKKLRFMFRDARAMSVQYNQLTGSYRYYYKMPDYIKDAIKRGDQVYLEDTPSVFLEAAQTDDYIEFPQDMFFHDRIAELAPMDRLYKGWSLPLFMPAFDLFIQMAEVAKFSEAVAMDFIRPMRIISPDASNLKAGVDDPNRMPMSGATFRNFMLSSLNKTRSNETTWVVSPVPVNTTLIGGEAKQLAPVDLLEWYADQIMQDLSIPMEFKQSSFQVVAPSMGLRMFERQWVMFAKSLHKFTNWVGQKVCDVEKVENMRVDLDITSFVEDDMNKQVRLQLMQAGVISKTEVLQSLGVDFQKDLDQRMQEQKAEQEAAMDMQTQDEGAQMVQSVMPPPGSLGVGQATMAIQATQGGGEGQPAMPGAPAAPAMPAGPQMAPMGGGQPGTPEQMWEEANNMAQQLYNAPPNVRRSELVNLKANNPQMHSFVKSILEQMEQQVSSDAVAQSKMPQG
jgi:hypothetical protein